MKYGDHLWVKKIAYTHHGIYIGHETVIHYSGLADGLTAGPICKASLIEFAANGEDIHVRSYDPCPNTDITTVHNVKSRLGEDEYDLQSNNCEHLCCWAKTGEHKSKQCATVETVIGFINPLGELVCKYRTFEKVRELGIKTPKKKSRSIPATLGFGLIKAVRWYKF